jgi:hypothetical protein
LTKIDPSGRRLPRVGPADQIEQCPSLLKLRARILVPLGMLLAPWSARDVGDVIGRSAEEVMQAYA